MKISGDVSVITLVVVFLRTEPDEEPCKETRIGTLKDEENQQDVVVKVLVTGTVDIRKVSLCFIIIVTKLVFPGYVCVGTK